jgi:hypothetical protein
MPADRASGLSVSPATLFFLGSLLSPVQLLAGEEHQYVD